MRHAQQLCKTDGSNSIVISDSDDEDLDSKPVIRVGEMYQAKVSVDTLPISASHLYGDKIHEQLLWVPTKALDTEVKKYCNIAWKTHKYQEDQALSFLYYHDCNLELTQEALKSHTPCPDTWTKDEKGTFEQALRYFGKDFDEISKVLPFKTIQEVILYYYLWKNTKKKYMRKSKKDNDPDVMIIDNDDKSSTSSKSSESKAADRNPMNKYTSKVKVESQYVSHEPKKELDKFEKMVASSPATATTTTELKHEYAVYRKKIQLQKQECEALKQALLIDDDIERVALGSQEMNGHRRTVRKSLDR